MICIHICMFPNAGVWGKNTPVDPVGIFFLDFTKYKIHDVTILIYV